MCREGAWAELTALVTAMVLLRSSVPGFLSSLQKQALIMDFIYETDRLILRVIKTEEAEKVCDWYKQNRFDFERYEPKRSINFYTTEFHQKLIELEAEHILKGYMLRLYAFPKNHPEQILGTVSLRDVTRGPYNKTEIGYKIDTKFRRNGVAFEMLQKAVEIAFYDMDLRRIEALCMPWNTPSLNLLEKLGFEQEGVLRQYCEINGLYEDMCLYSILR